MTMRTLGLRSGQRRSAGPGERMAGARGSVMKLCKAAVLQVDGADTS